MEQWTNDDTSTEQIEDSSNSPPQKRAKRQPGDNSQQVETTSFNADPSDKDLNRAERLVTQPLKIQIVWFTFNFILTPFNFSPSEEDCALAPEENLEPNSAGLKSSRTGTSLWRSRILLRLRKNHCLPFSVLRGGPKKDCRIWYFPYSGILESHR